MYGYYNRKPTYSASERLIRKYKFQARKYPAYSPAVMSTRQDTRPPLSNRTLKQNTDPLLPNIRTRQNASPLPLTQSMAEDTRPPLSNRSLRKDTSPLPLARRAKESARALPPTADMRSSRQDIESPILDSSARSGDLQNTSLRYHVHCIARGLWKRFKEMSLLARIVLTLLTLYVLSSIVNMLIQLIILSMGWLYTILGIIASAIVIYEFFIKRRQKKS